MNARDEILARVRERHPDAAPPSAENIEYTTYPDPAQQFTKLLESVGGRCVQAADAAAASADLEQQPAYASAARRVSTVNGVGTSTLDLSEVDDPHDLADVDFAVLPGELAVAENGAVWVSTASVAERTLYFLAQHLALVVPASQVVNNLPEAYERINPSRHPFGTFISGPSKTADIEQALVIGAHGARSLTVYLLG